MKLRQILVAGVAVALAAGCSKSPDPNSMVPLSGSAPAPPITAPLATGHDAPGAVSGAPGTVVVPPFMKMGTSQTLAPTPALDAKIASLEKSHAPGPQLAAAHVLRGKAYIADSKALPHVKYPAALKEFRLALAEDPENSDAKAQIAQIVNIYQMMGRPVPGGATGGPGAPGGPAAPPAAAMPLPPMVALPTGAVHVPPGMSMGTSQSLTPTPALDAKIAALRKSKAPGPKLADAYVDRAYARMSDSNAIPHVKYPAALSDFRAALKADPNNLDASHQIDQIEGIYRQMHKPIPTG